MYLTDALNKGLLKIMSKMGISNVSSYRGSRLLMWLAFQKVEKDMFLKNAFEFDGDCFNDIHEKMLAVLDSDLIQVR